MKDLSADAVLKKVKANWGWLLALGILILSHWPMSGMWFIGLLIVIEMLINGWTYILIAFAAKNA